jgi:alginate O-acetyltransferase complex protein AlgI
MLFQSQEFVLVFLPITLALYYAVARHPRARAAVTIIASLVFYAWWDIRFLPLFVGHCVIAWAGPLLAQVTRRRAFIDAAIVLQLLSLAVFKYANFIVANVEHATGYSLPRADVVLPIGISFFTFQLISYLVDVRRGQAKPYPLQAILLYISFFPHLIAGPIVRHNELLPQFAADPLRPGLAERLGKGLTLFIIGMAKKVLLADILALTTDRVFGSVAGLKFGDAWGGALSFTFQLFLDFSAYSEMAIGLALMFGLWLPENFQTPYRAGDLRDFWRRWHITLSRFLRDYVYVPLGGSRDGPIRFGRATLVTMALCGLWHGAGWTYVIWGLYHGIGLLVCAGYRALARPMPYWLGWSLTMLFVIVGWVVFRSGSLTNAWDMLGIMAGTHGFTGKVDRTTLLVIAAAVSIGMPSSHDLIERWLRPSPVLAVALAGLFAFLLLWISKGQPVSFIYFQF